jgi:hypothetical protein
VLSKVHDTAVVVFVHADGTQLPVYSPVVLSQAIVPM